MNKIFFGDNLKILKSLHPESVDLIYIDPPFNTGKTQKLTSIKTIKSEEGDRTGFSGNTYQSITLGTKSYNDLFESDVGLEPKELARYQQIMPNISYYYIEEFLKPRLLEAYRILKPTGALYFHIDYREVHYCKILLDNIFGRESFISEIIWAYDYGGKSRSKWPAKHDNILFYVKDPKNYIWNTNEADRIPYMAPGLVGPEKAKKGKLPTDTWWYEYVGGKRPTDTWWHTIVGTNSKERLGYPTQKPLRIIERIVKTSTLPGQTVIDFFAGSGTVGEACLKHGREFILIDKNIEALEVMAFRFSNISNIKWINFDPNISAVEITDKIKSYKNEQNPIDRNEYSEEFQKSASDSTVIRSTLQTQNDYWKDSPFEWVLQIPARRKSVLGKHLIESYLSRNNFIVSGTSNKFGVNILVNGKIVSIKFSTLWEGGYYKLQQIRENNYEYL
ncbi:MAG: site-specific DNA-methyltransferase, partial [Anaerolineales bacterium]